MAGRAARASNLYTCSIVALNPDTGKMAWYFQVSPHDTHDWDAVETPVLIDGEIDGQAAQAAGAGQPQRLFLRAGPHQRQEYAVEALRRRLNWSKGLDAKGQPIRNPDKEPKPDGTLVIPTRAARQIGLLPRSIRETGLFYVNASESYGLY